MRSQTEQSPKVKTFYVLWELTLVIEKPLQLKGMAIKNSL